MPVNGITTRVRKRLGDAARALALDVGDVVLLEVGLVGEEDQRLPRERVPHERAEARVPALGHAPGVLAPGCPLAG
jgi:hypothetical protein